LTCKRHRGPKKKKKGAPRDLVDFGADVIKVERRAESFGRHATQASRSQVAEGRYCWHLANRNKRGMTLD